MEVVVYGKPNCPYCDKAKATLEERGIEYTYLDINEDLSLKEILLEKGLKTVPQIFVNGEYHGESDSAETVGDYLSVPITEVVKSDGSVVKFDPDKLNNKARWAAQRKVNWSNIVLKALKRLHNKCTTKDINQALINTCVEEFDEKHFKLAGRILAGVIYKDAFGGFTKIPTLKEHHDKMSFLTYWEGLPYSEEEFEYLNSVMDHGKDLDYSYPEIKQISDKYVIRNRVKNIALESPQFMYMGMAMANMKKQPKERRVEDVVKLYTYLSDKKICAPTPFMTKLRTPDRGFASCSVHTTDDTIESLAAGDHISYIMTAASAGIGSHIKTRSKGDEVREGMTVHQGKRSYYKNLESNVAANLQGGRGGSATVHCNVLDPEIEDIITWKSKKTASKVRVDGIHYSVGFNSLFARKVRDNEDWLLVSYKDDPDLYEAMYEGDQGNFENLYYKAEALGKYKKINARKLALDVLIQGQESGQVYLHRTDELNRHTPFKDKIYSSNLCVSPDTLLLTDKGYLRIKDLAGTEVTLWNGEQWVKSPVAKTGSDKELIKVKVAIYVGGEYVEDKELICTPYHKWYLETGEEVKTSQLELNSWLEPWITPEGTGITSRIVDIYAEENDDTYCVNEPIRHKAVFNGILTGQCQEIALPTKPFKSVTDLYTEASADDSEIGLCSLGATVVRRIKSDEEYKDVMYYIALMIDNVIDTMDYPFPNLKATAQARRSLGIGVTDLAGYMAEKKLKFSSKEGKKHLHILAERHMYYAIEASLRLAEEKGISPWSHKTKWSEGWLPIDTMNKNVYKVVGQELTRDWEDLRSRVQDMKGLRNSVLVALMPNESSSIATNGTNSILPARSVKTIKTNANKKTRFLVPNADTHANYYELAWDIAGKDMIDVYAIWTCFTDQTISADEYLDFTKGDITSKDLLDRFLYMAAMGVKTRYYTNSKTNSGSDLLGKKQEPEVVEDVGCAGGGCAL